jgi:hypothetical protein
MGLPCRYLPLSLNQLGKNIAVSSVDYVSLLLWEGSEMKRGGLIISLRSLLLHDHNRHWL